MYSGNNPTAKKSQEWISEALFILLDKNKFTDLSITEICKKSGVSRQTFYKLFEDKEEVVYYFLKNKVFNALTELKLDKNYSTKKVIKKYFEVMMLEQEKIKLVFKNHLEYLIKETLRDVFINIHSDLSIYNTEDVNEIMSHYISNAAFGFTLYWLNNDISDEKITEICVLFLNPDVLNYQCKSILEILK